MLRLEIVTPEKSVFDKEVDGATVPTASGQVGLLPSHVPLISALKPGILSYTNKGVTERFAIGGGFVEISGNKVAILTDSAETAAEIDVEAAKAEKESVEKALAAAASAAVEQNEPLRERLDAVEARLALAAGR